MLTLGISVRGILVWMVVLVLESQLRVVVRGHLLVMLLLLLLVLVLVLVVRKVECLVFDRPVIRNAEGQMAANDRSIRRGVIGADTSIFCHCRSN